MANYIKDMFIDVTESKTKEATAINEVVEEVFLEEIENLDINTLLGMIEEVMDEPREINEDIPPVAGVSDEEAVEMILKMIPNIEVSEIGWSDVRTPDDGQEIKGPQRKLLEDYLRNIKGSDFAEKISSVSRFYTNGVAMVEAQGGNERAKRISQAISYLVFYKTLTKVITNFNASSAGFSFESFLAALVNGFQIPANTGTIADYVDRASGAEIPVSLKLYKEGNLEVGGSYTDLVRDLVDPKYPGSIGGAMRYVVCTKSLEGEDLNQEGKIDFYQFDISLDNVMNIIAFSKQKSQRCIMIPKQIASALQAGRVDGVSMSDTLPGEGNLPSDEDLEKLFIKYLDEVFKMKDISLSQMQTNDILQGIDYAKKDEMFNDWIQQIGDDKVNKGIVRGRSTLNKDKVRKMLQSLDWVPIKNDQGKTVSDYFLAGHIIAANNAVINDQKKQKLADQRNQEIKRMVAEGEFLSPEESARVYNDMGPRQKRVALLNSWGYLTRGHFSLNQKQAVNPAPPTNTLALGSINVGRQEVKRVVDSIRDILNEEVMEIFQSLKVLSDSLNSFFAGGLSDDSLANTSVESANNISSKQILKTNE
tara:strand:- start:1748 stop:3520 length:1773 start_codon:yes stop_codon:yes gene_type:complete